MPVFLGVVPVLRMFDPQKTLEFYVDLLGFKIDWERRFFLDLPLYLQISMKDIVLHLSEHHGDASPGAKVYIHIKVIAKFQATLTAKKYRFAKPCRRAVRRDHDDGLRSDLQPTGLFGVRRILADGGGLIRREAEVARGAGFFRRVFGAGPMCRRGAYYLKCGARRSTML